MPDLAEEAVETYWQSKGRDLARTVIEIEDNEDWTLDDHPRIRDAILALGMEVDEAKEGRLSEMAMNTKCVDDARMTLAYISAGKRFRLLAALAEEHPDGAPLAANILSPDTNREDAAEAARVLRTSVRHLARLNLLYKVFAPERLRLILDAIREEDDDES